MFDFIGSSFDTILHLSPGWLLLVVGTFVFAEDAIFVGFAIPGETAAVIAGVASSLYDVNLAIAILVVVAAAIAGDSVGYEVGKHFFGPKVLNGRFFTKRRASIERAQSFLRRRGGLAVFFGRFTAFFRAMMPALAGSAHMPYRKFLFWNAAGGIVWGTGFVVLGHVAGSSYHAIEQRVGRSTGIVLVVLVVILLALWKFRSERQEAD